MKTYFYLSVGHFPLLVSTLHKLRTWSNLPYVYDIVCFKSWTSWLRLRPTTYDNGRWGIVHSTHSSHVYRSFGAVGLLYERIWEDIVVSTLVVLGDVVNSLELGILELFMYYNWISSL